MRNLMKACTQIIFILALCLTFANISYAESLTAGDYEYEIKEDGTAVLTKYTGTAASISIPGSVGGYEVTELGSWCFSENQAVKSVDIPESIETIGESCFWACHNLEIATLVSGLQTIESRAFAQTNLKKFEIPGTVTTIGYEAFSRCEFKEVTVPKSVATWGKAVFNMCPELTAVTFEEGITAVPERMFSGCEQLSSIKLPSTLENIGESAFKSCGTIKELVLPVGLVNIGDDAFAGTTIDKLDVQGTKVVLTVLSMRQANINEIHCYRESAFWEQYKDNSYVTLVRKGTYISKETASIKTGKTVQLQVVNPVGSTKWSTSNSKVAQVSASGLVTGYAPGTAVISAENNGITMTCKVTVTKLKLNKSKVTFSVGCTVQLNLPNADKSKVKWSSSNKKVATVTSKGVVTAKKKGKTVICATYFGQKYKCTVVVKTNERNIKDYPLDINRYPENNVYVGFSHVSRDKKGNFVVEGHVVNRYPITARYVENFKLMIVQNGKTIASQKWSRLDWDVPPGTIKKIKLTIKKKNVKKNIDLRKGKVGYAFDNCKIRF